MDVFYPTVKREKLECSICEKTFYNQQGLSNHIKTHSRKRRERVLCDKCSRTFRDTYTLETHLKTYHENPKKKAVACGLCSAEISGNVEDHLLTAHEISVEKECYDFETLKDFFTWKEDIEKATSSYYVKFRGTKVDKLGNKTSYFNCHRRGFFSSRGTNKRQSRASGSNKINGHCPASLVLREAAGKCSVVYVKTHIGHSAEVKRLPLTRAEKDFVAEKLANSISVNDILKEVKDSVSVESVSRLQLLSRKDILNIGATYKISIPRLKKEPREDQDHSGVQGEGSLTEEELVDEDRLAATNTKSLGTLIEIPVHIEIQSEGEVCNFLAKEEVLEEKSHLESKVYYKEDSSYDVWSGSNQVQVQHSEHPYSSNDVNTISLQQSVENQNKVENFVGGEGNSPTKGCRKEVDSFNAMQTKAVEEFTKIMRLADTREKLALVLNRISSLPDLMSEVDDEDIRESK